MSERTRWHDNALGRVAHMKRLRRRGQFQIETTPFPVALLMLPSDVNIGPLCSPVSCVSLLVFAHPMHSVFVCTHLLVLGSALDLSKVSNV